MWSDSQDNADFASKPKIAGGWNKRTKGCCMYVTDIKYETPLSKINIFIISMTKLLDADWLRGVQLFH